MFSDSRNDSQEKVLPEFPACFVCGKENPRGLKLRFFQDVDGVQAAFLPDRTLAGYENTVHGGIISAVLDEAIVWAVYIFSNCLGVTADLNVRFLKPLSVSNNFRVKGRVTEDKGRYWIVESRLMDQENTVYAKAIGKVFPITQKKE